MWLVERGSIFKQTFLVFRLSIQIEPLKCQSFRQWRFWTCMKHTFTLWQSFLTDSEYLFKSTHNVLCLAPVRTSEEPVRQVPRTTIRPTLIQIILADSIIVKFEVGVGGGWRRDRGGASVFSCKLSSSKNQSSEVAMWRLYRRRNFALISEPHAAAAKLRTLGWAKQDLWGLGAES